MKITGWPVPESIPPDEVQDMRSQDDQTDRLFTIDQAFSCYSMPPIFLVVYGMFTHITYGYSTVSEHRTISRLLPQNLGSR